MEYNYKCKPNLKADAVRALNEGSKVMTKSCHALFYFLLLVASASKKMLYTLIIRLKTALLTLMGPPIFRQHDSSPIGARAQL